MALALMAENPGAWPFYRFEDLYALDRTEREALQLAALKLRFERLREKVPALQRLAAKQGIERIESLTDVLPLLFDHRVLKNYPLSVLENRDFPKLTAWLNKLTAHDLTRVDLGGLKTIDDWLDRLTRFGMLIGTSSGTGGKLSFVPRSKDEFGAWRASFLQLSHAACGLDSGTTKLPYFVAGYRTGSQMAIKIIDLFADDLTGDRRRFHTLYDTHMSTDLMALSGRMQAAEERGELDRLGLDPALIEQRRAMIEAGRRKEQDMEIWFARLIDQYRGQQVRIGGLFSELFRVAKSGLEKGIKCSFAPGSVMVGGGGLKGYKGAPENWEEIVMEFFGINRLGNLYGFSESMGSAPLCTAGYFHFMPYTIPMLLDSESQALPREGVQRGRLAVFDLLAESYWGAFISSDEVTMHWDEKCDCGWGGPRIEKKVRRFTEAEGGDDKITCAGSAQAYNEFMDYVMGGE